MSRGKLQDFQIQNIREGVNEGKTLAVLAAEYKCSVGLISKIISHKLYKIQTGASSGEYDEIQEFFMGNHERTPEMFLIEAFLLLVRDDIIYRPKSEHCDEAINWILRDDSGKYSFTNITDYLGLDTEKTKRAFLKNVTHHQFKKAEKWLKLTIERNIMKRIENSQFEEVLNGN